MVDSLLRYLSLWLEGTDVAHIDIRKNINGVVVPRWYNLQGRNPLKNLKTIATPWSDAYY